MEDYSDNVRDRLAKMIASGWPEAAGCDQGQRPVVVIYGGVVINGDLNVHNSTASPCLDRKSPR